MNTPLPATNNISSFITTLRTRATALQKNARVTIALIVFVLLAGIGGFLYAGPLGAREATQARTTLFQQEIDAINRSIETTEKDVRSFQIKIDQEEHEQSGDPNRESRLNSLRHRLSEAQAREVSLRDSLEKLNQQQFALADESKLTLNNPNTYQIAAAIATRVGFIVLLLFLVRILVPLYRYNVRLASFYDARADALELIYLHNLGANNKLFEKLTLTCSPSHIDFSDGPASPTQEALDLAKQFLNSKMSK